MRFAYKFITTLFIIFLILVIPSNPSLSMGDDEAKIVPVKSIKVINLGKEKTKAFLADIAEREQSNPTDSKGILGEVAAIALFATRGYEILENQARRLIGCELTSKTGKAGIDGIFLREGAVSIFNEAKYRQKGCKPTDLPYVSYGQEMSPHWVSYHFSHLRDQGMTRSPQCAAVNFQQLEKDYELGHIMRTMTCLRENGEIDLYYIYDKNPELNEKVMTFLSTFADFDISLLEKALAKYLPE